MTIEADPLTWEELPEMATVEEVRRFLRVSDASCRKFAKEHDLYIKVSGNARIPKEGLKQVLFEKTSQKEETIIDELNDFDS